MQNLVTFERRDPEATVLVLTNMWPRHGREASGIFVERQVNSLIEAGIRCDVVVVHGHRSPRAYGAAAFRLFVLAIQQRRRYELVHAHGGETAFAARCYWRAPLVISFCGSDLLGAIGANGSISPAWRIRRRLVRELARLAQATITKSAELAERLPASVRRRNAVIPNGVDRDLFHPIPRGVAREELGWEVEERIALFAADPDVPSKRFELASAACEAARGCGWRGRLEVAHRVPPNRMPLLMSGADCLLLTSATEGSPNVVKEALACGLPVVSTAVGDVRSLLAGVSPSAVVAADPDQLAHAIVECTRDPARSNGREMTASLAQNEIAKRILEVYRRVAPGVA